MRDAVVRDAVVRDAVVRDAVVGDAVMRDAVMRDAVVWNVRYRCERCRRGECEMPLGSVIWTGRKGSHWEASFG